MLLDLWNYANRVKSIEMNNGISDAQRSRGLRSDTFGTEKKDEE